MRFKAILLTLFIIITFVTATAQTKEKKNIFYVGADLMSQYLWRGTCLSKVPNVQPTVYYEAPFGLKAGAWGSYSVTGNYTESDIFLSYTLKGITLTVTDYFIICEGLANTKYFNYNNKNTDHAFEAAIGYDGPEKLPIHFLAATMFYGADKKIDKTIIDPVTNDTTRTYENQFSTYIEAGYIIRNFTLFIGFTPMKGLYGNAIGVVNLGLTAKKDIKLSEKFSLPVQASVITNPQRGSIYFVFGITL